jgi:uncharacterized protein YecE (DUF72 family)
VETFVGTSGWSYAWNEGSSLDWYVAHAGLNAIELNFSYYRFPSDVQVKSWARAGSGLRWSVKVTRSVTHLHRFNKKALEIWHRFFERFSPMDSLIDFYLFQAPPNFHNLDRIAAFIKDADLGERFALEIRNPAALGSVELMDRFQDMALLVSVDSPDFQNLIFRQDRVYLRMHGRQEWYRHDYAAAELGEVRDRIREIGPKQAYIFFNNDAMLANARMMRELL